MSDYHVGCGLFGIYAGTLREDGETWKAKSDVTSEALSAVAEHLLLKGKEYRFTYRNRDYALKIEAREQPEIIRCKDCKFFDGSDCFRYGDETSGIPHSTQEYGFCWLAERREQND